MIHMNEMTVRTNEEPKLEERGKTKNTTRAHKGERGERGAHR